MAVEILFREKAMYYSWHRSSKAVITMHVHLQAFRMSYVLNYVYLTFIVPFQFDVFYEDMCILENLK